MNTPYKYKIVDVQPDFLLIAKSPGVSVHRDTQLSGLVMQISSDRDEPLFLVHRLDKVTSGLMLLARNQTAAAALSRLFAERAIEKYYLAMSTRKPAKKQGTVKGDMQRSRRSGWKLSKTCHNPAITRFFSQAVDPGRRLFVLKPETGKTHQIRVAMKSLGVPILGDERYGGEPAERVYLHAWQLRFSYQGVPYHYRCPPCCGSAFATPAVVQQLQRWHNPELLHWPGPTREQT